MSEKVMMVLVKPELLITPQLSKRLRHEWSQRHEKLGLFVCFKRFVLRLHTGWGSPPQILLGSLGDRLDL